MIRKNLLCLLVFASIFALDCEIALSQNYQFIKDRCFGTPGGDLKCRIGKLNNNLFIAGITGFVGTNEDKWDSSCNSTDIWYLLVDTALNIINSQAIGGQGVEDYSTFVIDSAKNRIVVSAISNSDSSCDKSTNSRGSYDYWVAFLDSNLTKTHDYTFGSPSVEGGCISVLLTGGNLGIIGTSRVVVGGDKTAQGYGNTDYWVVKMDSTGNKAWDYSYGGSLEEYSNFVNQFHYDVIATTGDSMLIFGNTLSPANGTISVPMLGSTDFWAVMIDSSGTQVWDKRFGGNSHDYMSKILIEDDGYIIVGSTLSTVSGTVGQPSIGNYDVWILKIDKAGNKLWDGRYGSVDGEQGFDIQPAPDGGYWILASTTSLLPSGDVSEPSYGGVDYWMIKVDSVGNFIWEKRFGSSGTDMPSNFVIMNDGSIYICGQGDAGTSTVKTDSGKGGSDYWIVHFNYYNNNTTVIENDNVLPKLNAWPNPFHDDISIDGIPSGQHLATLFSTEGRQLWESRLNGGRRVTLNFPSLPNGLYFLQVQGKTGRRTIKIFKE
jgi:hypothetical protein